MRVVYSIFLSFLIFGLTVTCMAQTKSSKPKTEAPRQVFTLTPSDCRPINELAVVTILENGDLMLGSAKLEKVNFIREVKNRVCGKVPSEQVIYIKANTGINFSRVIEILKLGREIEIDDFGLITSDSNISDVAPTSIMIKVPEVEDDEDSGQKIKAFPLSLFVSLTKEGQFSLNSKPETTDSLTKKLKQIFLTRKQKKIYIQGSREVEKTVFVATDENARFGDVLNIIEIVKAAGAFPIGVDVDNFYKRIIF